MDAISMFSGAMGLDLGLEDAGFRVRCALEIDPGCCATIRANRPGFPLIESDVMKMSAADIFAAAGVREIDVVCGGPPCQAFSTAGKRLGLDDDRGNVFLKFLDLVADMGPRYAVIENVRGLLSAPAPDDQSKGGAIRLIASRLKDAGYSTAFTLYDASLYGVPQRRERVIIIASREGQVPLIPPTHGGSDQPARKTFREAVSGLGPEHHHGEFLESRLRFLRMLGPGQDWRNLPENMQREAMGGAYESQGGRVGFYRRVAWDKPCPTLLTSPTQKATCLCHPEEDRPLSVEEYAAVQQFPADWRFEGNLASVYRQIGNAVPTGLGAAVGRHLMRWDSERSYPESTGMRHSRYLRTSHTDILGST